MYQRTGGKVKTQLRRICLFAKKISNYAKKIEIFLKNRLTFEKTQGIIEPELRKNSKEKEKLTKRPEPSKLIVSSVLTKSRNGKWKKDPAGELILQRQGRTKFRKTKQKGVGPMAQLNVEQQHMAADRAAN